MRIYTLLVFILLGFAPISKINAQAISSKIIDSVTQKPIPYVTVQWANKKGAITNEEGRFSILLEKNAKETDSLFISCLGYELIARPINTFDEKVIYLSPSAIELKEVLVSNKQYTADEIIDLVNDNIEKNYNFDLTKKRLFFRKSSFQRMLKNDFSLKKSTIEALNKKFLDSIIKTVPESNSYYTEVLGDLYGNYEDEKQKLNLIKASELYDKNMELDFEKVEKKFNEILKKNIKTDSYFKIKSGLFGTKVDTDEIFEEEVDSTDVAAVNEQLAKTKKNEEERKKNFTNYRRKALGEILNTLPITDDTDLNFLNKSGRYEFTLQDFVYLGEDAVYVIDFKPKRSEDYKGTLYINSDDFALIRVDYENVKPIKTFKLLGVSLNQYLSKGKIIFSKGNDNRYGLRYFESENGNRMGIDRPLKIIELNKVVKGRNKQNELSGNIDFAFRNIDKNEVVVFDTENISNSDFDAFEEKKDILPTYMPSYNAEFWSGYNIIEPNQAIKEFSATEEIN
ncbi:carboxypeptidase-like regulatory domain-containing protein [Aurantibacter crassamenti]|uniref:carboxypeptidase-like regulatory domain-containing protein n=1 Tax=Aurantibacter crassamenti TaxID=1837375 RepID=UPI00193977E0|nr:carboxypeptidase-like regulatory domain-containing protein [Aurantibacter crassamenti]MBM1105456.1 carboxypeptidase-like regulatory domain-containing protein [Aurantibacter crassamenti]